MLKIKDDVDLKKIGFDKDEEDFIYQDDIGLCCEEDKIIYFGNMSSFQIDQDKHLDKLYDLIQAGLVEKIKE
jgi:hypothetical protein